VSVIDAVALCCEIMAKIWNIQKYSLILQQHKCYVI